MQVLPSTFPKVKPEHEHFVLQMHLLLYGEGVFRFFLDLALTDYFQAIQNSLKTHLRI